MKKVIVFYDDWCPNCTRFSVLAHKLDWFHLVQFKKLRDKNELGLFQKTDIELAKKQMASFSEKWHYGYNSIFLIALRLPLFWIIVPFLFVLKITKIGHFLYTELALKRKIIPIHCDSDSCEISK